MHVARVLGHSRETRGRVRLAPFEAHVLTTLLGVARGALDELLDTLFVSRASPDVSVVLERSTAESLQPDRERVYDLTASGWTGCTASSGCGTRRRGRSASSI